MKLSVRKTTTLLAIALLFTVLGMGMPSDAGAVDILAKFVPNATGDLDDPAWSGVSYVSAQLVQVYETYNAPYDPYAPPNPPSAKLPPRPIRIKAIHDGQNIWFNLRWEDATQDLVVNDVPRFADAVAIQIPFNGRDMKGADFLALCPESYHMGGLYKFENGDCTKAPNQCGAWIVFWRADLPKPQNITGVGFFHPPGCPEFQFPRATIQRTRDSNTLPNDASAAWRNGAWTVIFKRPLGAASPNMAHLQRGHHYPIAFSQWDGSLQERNGRKFATNDWGDSLIVE